MHLEVLSIKAMDKLYEHFIEKYNYTIDAEKSELHTFLFDNGWKIYIDSIKDKLENKEHIHDISLIHTNIDYVITQLFRILMHESYTKQGTENLYYNFLSLKPVVAKQINMIRKRSGADLDVFKFFEIECMSKAFGILIRKYNYSSGLDGVDGPLYKIMYNLRDHLGDMDFDLSYCMKVEDCIYVIGKALAEYAIAYSEVD